MITYEVTYATGKVFTVTGRLQILPSIFPGHPRVQTIFIDAGKELIGLDARAVLRVAGKVVHVGCTTAELEAALASRPER